MPVQLPYRNVQVTRDTAQVLRIANRCIYCPDGKPPYTREHAVPIGLGGGLIVPFASCARCQAEIKKVETYCMRGPFLPHRLANKLVRNLDDLSEYVTLKMIFGSFWTFGTVGTEAIPIRFHRDNVPDFLCMPRLYPAGIIANRQPGPFVQPELWVGGNEQRLRELHWFGNLILADRFDLIKFTRMLAKIAHAYIAGEIGLDDFEPMLPDFILGKNDSLGSYLVGGWPEDDIPQIDGSCQIGMAFSQWGEKTLVNTRLRLFPSHPQIPIYHVAVGTLTKPIDEVLAPLGLQSVPPRSGGGGTSHI